MAFFKLEKKIDSCLVTKNLLKQIEDYLLNELPKKTDIPKEKFFENYELIVRDKIGEEILLNISEYKISLFSDSTNYIGHHLSIYRPIHLEVVIHFNKYKEFAKIEISYESDNPREDAIGIYDSIKRIIESQRNHNNIFHINSLFYDLFLFIAIASFVLATFRFIKGDNITIGIIFSLIFTVLLFYRVLSSLKPYISFESKKYFWTKRLSDRLFWGALGLIIVEIIFAFLRKNILGF